ncbi:MAG: hypothetical protein AB1633_02005 [Elusimicrobiota bacterium]
MSKVLDEIHKIKEKFYEEEKGLTSEEVIKKIHKESEETIKKYGLKLRREEKKVLQKV